MNRKEENDQGRTDTLEVRPDEVRRPKCPRWCTKHLETNHGTVDHTLVHYGPEGEVAGYSVQLTRHDWLQADVPGEVAVRLVDWPLSLQQASALAGLLATTVSMHDPDEATVVHVMELPEGKDYVVFKDLNVVAVSSRLDENGRRLALSDAGVG